MNLSWSADKLVELMQKLALFSSFKRRDIVEWLPQTRPRNLKPNEPLILQGQFSDSFFVLLSGEFVVTRVEEDSRQEIWNLNPGNWFGEISALSNRPSLATLRAKGIGGAALEIPEPLFKRLFKDPTFKKRIDDDYRDRALAMHLRVVPLLKTLPHRAFDRLTRGAKRDVEKAAKDRIVDFITITREGQVIEQQGMMAGAIYLVRAGAVAVEVKKTGRAPKTHAYYGPNSSFGEEAYLERPTAWPGDIVVAAQPCHLVRIGRDRFRDLFADEDPDSMQTIEKTASILLGQDDPTIDEASRLAIEILINRQSVKGGQALAIDTSRCIRCNACVESCAAVHDDGVPRLSKVGTRVDPPIDEDLPTITLATACYHCEIPGCMISCPHGAIRRDPTGQIEIIEPNCVGCGACVTGCPYDVISMAPPRIGKKWKRRLKWFLRTLPLIGVLFDSTRAAWTLKNEPTRPVEEKAPPSPDEVNESGKPIKALAVKCDLCSGLPYESCVYNCPTEAIYRESPARVVALAEAHAQRAESGAS